jgi:hypothetical protein
MVTPGEAGEGRGVGRDDDPICGPSGSGKEQGMGSSGWPAFWTEMMSSACSVVTPVS